MFVIDIRGTAGSIRAGSMRGLLTGIALPIGAASAALLAFPNPATAQTTALDAVTPQGNGPGLQAAPDIVVTARRKSESIQRVPAAITAFTARDLQERQVFSESDLQRVTPGLTVRGAISNNQLNYSIRGQTIDAFSVSPPGVLPYINDVQVSNVGASNFFDIQSVQVLKGPQGTLFGRNTTGGAVLFNTAEPTNAVEGSLTVRLGDYERREMDAVLNFPIVDDKALLRVAANFTKRDGYVTNLLDGEHLGNVNSKSVRASLLLHPTDDFKNITVIQYNHSKGTNLGGPIYSLYTCGTPGVVSVAACAYGPFNPAFAQYAAAHPDVDPQGLTHYFNLQKERGPYEVEYNSPSFIRGENEFATNTTTYDISDDLVVKNIIGANFSKNKFSIDADGTPFGILNYGPFDATVGNLTKTTQFSEELQLQGTAFGGNLSYVVGGYYSWQKDRFDNPLWFFDFSPLAPPIASANDNKVVAKSQAPFGQATFDLGEWTGIDGLNFTAGARYTFAQVKGTQLPKSAFFPGPVLKQDFSEPSWTVGLDYQARPDLLLYIVHRGSWRSGGINVFTAPTSGTADVGGSLFDPETTKDIEIGAKFSGRLAGIPFRLNVDAFNQWIEDVQRVVYLPSSAAVTANVPSAEVTGVEVDTQINLFPWLTLGGATSYNDARFTKDSLTFFGNTTTFGPYPDTPRWSGSIFGVVEMPVPEDIGQVTLRADYYAQSSTYFSSANNTFNPGTKLPSYGITNFRINWDDILGSTVGASFFVKNAFDQLSYLGGLQLGSAFGLNTAIPGAPRMIGGELRFRF